MANLACLRILSTSGGGYMTTTRAALNAFASSSTRLTSVRPTGFSRPLIARTLATVSTMPVPQPKAEITAEVGGQKNVEALHRLGRDFRSDTLSMPTDAQLLFALQASRGDDVYQEDSTTDALEKRIAKLAGKEAALFAVSGTMTNQLAIRAHMKQPPHSVICDHRAHIHTMEAGGIAMFSQATTLQLFPANKIHLTAEEIEPSIVPDGNIHHCPTKLICLENTLSGMIFPQHEVVRIGEVARKHGVAMHCDGARMWNVAAAEIEKRGLDPRSEDDLQTVLTELLAPFDTASLCLSKGIGAPIGSAVVGSRAFIEKVRWFRKAFGGGIRQAGGIAAAADYAITHHFPRLAQTHALARRLADGLKNVGCDILAPVDTSMVFFDPTPAGLTMGSIIARLEQLEDPIVIRGARCVVHHQTSPQAIEDFISCVAEMKREKEDGGHPESASPDVTTPELEDAQIRVRNLGIGY